MNKNSGPDKNFERKTAKDGSPFFVLKSADNGQVIGRSELYSPVGVSAMAVSKEGGHFENQLARAADWLISETYDGGGE